MNLLGNFIKNAENRRDEVMLHSFSGGRVEWTYGEAITENSVLKQFIKNFEDSVNRLNPLNAHPELREKLDQKYGLEQHKFGFIDCYTLKK